MEKTIWSVLCPAPIQNQMKVVPKTALIYTAEAEAAAVVMARTWVDSHVRNDPSD